MSLEARLNHAFDHATRGTNTSSEVILANLIASHHHHRRQHAIWLATAAVIAVVILAAGNGAAEWIRGMERDIAPVEDGQDRVNEQLDDEDLTRDLEGRLGLDDGTGLAGFSAGISERAGQRPAWIDANAGRTPTAGEEDSHGGAPQEEPGSSGTGAERDLTRIREKKWSTSPLGTEGPTTSFWVRRNETHIDVELRVTGGGGFGSPIMGEVYEIIGGVSRSLATFCGHSGLLEVAPGSRIEIHARSQGCDGTGTYLKGITRMLFYR